jgi:hypothetical protein
MSVCQRWFTGGSKWNIEGIQSEEKVDWWAKVLIPRGFTWTPSAVSGTAPDFIIKIYSDYNLDNQFMFFNWLII